MLNLLDRYRPTLLVVDDTPENLSCSAPCSAPTGSKVAHRRPAGAGNPLGPAAPRWI